nr:hypothetical protein [Tanacetum cinerariifolium]
DLGYFLLAWVLPITIQHSPQKDKKGAESTWWPPYISGTARTTARNLPDLGELISILNSEIRKNLSTTCVYLPIEDDHSPLLAYVVWICLAYLKYPVIPPYLHPFKNKDTIFDPGITINRFYSFKPGLSHRCGTFEKFNTHRSHLNEWPMIINGKNIPILDVLLFHFYPP